MHPRPAVHSGMAALAHHQYRLSCPQKSISYRPQAVSGKWGRLYRSAGTNQAHIVAADLARGVSLDIPQQPPPDGFWGFGRFR